MKWWFECYQCLKSRISFRGWSSILSCLRSTGHQPRSFDAAAVNQRKLLHWSSCPIPPSKSISRPVSACSDSVEYLSTWVQRTVCPLCIKCSRLLFLVIAWLFLVFKVYLFFVVNLDFNLGSYDCWKIQICLISYSDWDWFLRVHDHIW